MTGVARLVVLSIALVTAGYSLWLLLVGIPVEVTDLSGSGGSERSAVIGAIVPMGLSVLVAIGLSRGSMPMAWTGAVGVLVYGLLAIFGMGLYVPLLGLLLVAAMAWYSFAVRREDDLADRGA